MKNIVAFVLLIGIVFTCSANALEISRSAKGLIFISYQGKPAFGFGASPQNILTYLPSGNGNNYRHWLRWASRHEMNHVRSYPPSFLVEFPALNVFKSAGQNSKVDLRSFNASYFDALRRACKLFRDKGFFVHLQLWQAVAWKKQWTLSYYNPANNINPDISLHASPGEFMVIDNAALLDHQKEYVRKILDATGDLGNVYFDIANEIGNGTANSKDWVIEMIRVVREWEQETGIPVLVTINDEGGMRVPDIEEIFAISDLIVKDLGRWDEHVEARKRYGKPTVSVRNIDWDYELQERRYFYGADNLEINEDEILQIRGRKYWWRMYMAKVQMAGAYADTSNSIDTLPGAGFIHGVLGKLGLNQYFPRNMKPSYDLNQISETYFMHFIHFVKNVADYPDLEPFDSIVNGHPAAHSYCLQSDKEIVIYLESPNGRAGITYPKTSVILTNLMMADGLREGYFYEPRSGLRERFAAEIIGGQMRLKVPVIHDDLAIHIQ